MTVIAISVCEARWGGGGGGVLERERHTQFSHDDGHWHYYKGDVGGNLMRDGVGRMMRAF